MIGNKFNDLSRCAMMALIAALLGCSSVARAAITIETVPIGDVGNPNDPATGNLYGGVSYAYNVGKYEVTVGQYTVFLNAVAKTDTNGLYNPNMATALSVAGIAQNGSSGSYTYSVIGSPNHPVTYVSWADAARFANWLHNGQPTGAQDASTTDDGAYSRDYTTGTAISRNTGAKWFIPSENEWYKAAYYQPAAKGGDADNYWIYPMRTNSVPYSDQPPGATPNNARVGNFYSDDGVANGYNDGFAVSGSTALSSQNYLTDAGAYMASPTFYGTYDQGGNVWEWDEALLINGRGIRGGSWSGQASLLASSYRSSGLDPSLESDVVGFRVATIVPEPSAAGYAALVIFFINVLPRRRK